MAKTIDLTKVNLSVKATVYLSAAFAVVLVCYEVGKFGAVKIKEALKGAAAGIGDEVEEF